MHGKSGNPIVVILLLTLIHLLFSNNARCNLYTETYEQLFLLLIYNRCVAGMKECF